MLQFRGPLRIRDKMPGQDRGGELRVAFPYGSSRKRMSVVVRLPPALVEACGGGEPVRLYSKGADSVMLELLAEGSRGSDPASLEALDKLLYEWADIALRTLVFAKREVTSSAAMMTRLSTTLAAGSRWYFDSFSLR